MAKSEGERCVLTMPLLTEPWQEHIMETRFRIVEHLQNSLIAKELRKLKNLQRRRDYRDLLQRIRDTAKEERGPLYKEYLKMRKEAKFSEYDFKDDLTQAEHSMQKHFSCHLQAQDTHTIASDVWRAFEKAFANNMFDPASSIHFKRRGSVQSFSCQSMGGGMKYRDGLFIWSGGKPRGCDPRMKQIVLKCQVCPPRNEYEKAMLALPIKRLRVVRKWVKSRYKYYLQFTLVGKPVRRERPTVPGRVGIDIGTQSIAIASAEDVKLLELAPAVNPHYRRMKQIQRKMDASRRAMNPDNYSLDGTIVRGKKLFWTYSNHYRRLAGRLRELQRKNAAIRVYQHNCLANYILSLGSEIIVEPMNYRGLQHRAKDVKQNRTGRPGSKKRFGKSLANKAPAALLTLLEQKAVANPLGGGLYRVDQWEFRASQYDHLSQKYSRKKLSQRNHRLENGDILQRDLYSAFLLMNADRDLCHPDQKRCERNYPTFKQLHDRELDRIRATTGHRLSSFGI